MPSIERTPTVMSKSPSDIPIPVVLDLMFVDGSWKKDVSFFCRPYNSDPDDVNLYWPRLIDMFDFRHPEKLIFAPWLTMVREIRIHTPDKEYSVTAGDIETKRVEYFANVG